MSRLCLKRVFFGTFLAAILLSGISVPAWAGEAPAKTIDELLKMAEEGLQKAEKDAKQKLQKADELYEQGKYDEAKKLYEEASKRAQSAGVDLGYDQERHLRRRLEDVADQIKKEKVKQAQAKFAQATELYQQGRYEEAKALFLEVQQSGVDIGFFKSRELKRYLSHIDEDIKTGKQERQIALDSVTKAAQKLSELQKMGVSDLLSDEARAKLDEVDKLLKAGKDRSRFLPRGVQEKLANQEVLYAQLTQKRQNEGAKLIADLDAKFQQARQMEKEGKLDESAALLKQIASVSAPVAKTMAERAAKRLAKVEKKIQARDQRERARLAKQQELKQKLADGKQLLAKGQFQAAIDAFEEVADAEDLLDPATIAEAQDLIAKAEAAAKAAEEAHKRRKIALKQAYEEGVEMLKEERYRDAKAAFDKVLALLKEDSQLEKPDELDEQIAQAEKAIQKQEEEQRRIAAKRQEFVGRLAKAQTAVAEQRYGEARMMLAELVAEIKATGIALPQDKQALLTRLAAKANEGYAAQQEAEIKARLAQAEEIRRKAEERLTEQQRAEQLIQEAIARQKVQEQLRRAEAAHHFETAQRLFRETKFKEAERELNKAVQLNPDLTEAQELLSKVRQILTEQGQPDVLTFAQAVEKERLVRIEKAKLDLANFIAEGQRAMAEKRYDDAIESFKNAQSVISYLEKEIDVTADRNKVMSLLADAKARKLEAEKLAEAEKERKAREAMRRFALRDQQRFHEKKTELFTRGWRLMKEERFDEAVKVANMILEIDPEDQSAKLLLEQANSKRHAHNMHKNVARLEREKKRGFEDIVERATPYSKIVNYVDRETWEREIASREPVKSFVGTGEDTEAAKKIKAALKKPVTLDFADTPVKDVITFLQDFTGVNMVLDPNAVKDNGAPITLKVQEMPLENALDFILKFANLQYQIQKDAIFISNKEGLSQYDLRTYDVRDLLIAIQDQEIESVNLSSGGSGGLSGLGSSGSDEEELDLNDRAVDLLTLITNIIAPETWKYAFVSGGGTDSDNDIELPEENEDAQGGIVYREGDIMVWQIPSIHEKIGELLQGMRETRNMQVSIEARFIRMTDNFEEHLGVTIQHFTTVPNPQADPNSHSGLEHSKFFHGPSTGYLFPTLLGNPFLVQPFNAGGGTAPFIGSNVAPGNTGMNLNFTYLGNYFVQGFLRAVQESDEAESLTCPRITLTNTQRGNVINATEITYIPTFTASSGLAVPTVQTVMDGVVFDVRPIVSADRRYVFLELKPSLTDVTIVTFNFNQTRGQGTNQDTVVTTLQQPRTDIQSVAVTVCVPDRGTVMIGGLSSRDKHHTVSGVPILSKIPLVKRLFQDDNSTNVKSNVLLLVRPEIIIQEEQEAKL